MSKLARLRDCLDVTGVAENDDIVSTAPAHVSSSSQDARSTRSIGQIAMDLLHGVSIIKEEAAGFYSYVEQLVDLIESLVSEEHIDARDIVAQCRTLSELPVTFFTDTDAGVLPNADVRNQATALYVHHYAMLAVKPAKCLIH